MVEPTKPGFTDVVWEAREPEQLARDLVSGAGAVPAAEAGLAWARLSAGFGAAAIEYERILANLDTAWESQNSRAFIERIRALRDWFTESAAAAAGNAIKAETHAAAYEIARLAMPDAGEVEQIRDMQKLLETVGAAIGAPMLAQVAKADEDADAAKAVAARVMRTYEATTEPLATPWEHQAAPAVTAGMEALTEAPAAAPAEAEAPQVSGGVPQMPIGPINIPRVLTRISARGVTPVTNVTSEKTTVQPVTVQQGVSSMPMAPAAAGGHGQDEEEHTVRPGLAGVPGSDEALGLTSGMQVAPAVLGGVDPNAQRIPDIAFNAASTGSEPAAPAAPAATAEAAS